MKICSRTIFVPVDHHHGHGPERRVQELWNLDRPAYEFFATLNEGR